MDLYYESLDSFLEAQYRFIHIFGENTLQVASIHSAIAVIYFHLDELRTALTHQEKAHKIITFLEKQETKTDKISP